MSRVLRYLIVALVCAAAVGLSVRYLLKPADVAQPVAAHGGGEGHAHDEGVKLSDAQVAAAGIELLPAGPHELHELLRLAGLAQPNQEALVKVTSRFPGVIRSMRKRLGDKVRKDEILATVESNQSLTIFELRAPIDGTVIDRDGTLGEFASEQKPLFTIADLSTLWIDFAVHRRDFARVRVGDAVAIESGDGAAPTDARIDYISPLGSSETQTFVARAVVPNASGLRPGLFVVGRLLLAVRSVPVAVRAAAIQTLEGKPVVFVRSGDGFQPREVELGERDADWIEVRFGLLEGDVYAARNSFVIKAEIGKNAAAHEH